LVPPIAVTDVPRRASSVRKSSSVTFAVRDHRRVGRSNAKARGSAEVSMRVSQTTISAHE